MAGVSNVNMEYTLMKYAQNTNCENLKFETLT